VTAVTCPPDDTVLPPGAPAPAVLTKDLLRVDRRGGYRPEFAGRAARPLAARVLGTYQGHVGEPRADLQAALTDLEREAEDFKLVRGFAHLLERDATFETRAPVSPERARRAAYEAAEDVGVVTEDERETALERAGEDLGAYPRTVAESLYADREDRQVLAAFDADHDPDSLVAEYDRSLAATALFDATEVRVRSSDPKRLVTAVKRLGLLYEVRRTDAGREVVVTGPDALFTRSRRYGTAFARLLSVVAEAVDWRLEATVDDHGTERTMTLTHEDPVTPPRGVDPEPTYDSGVEADFAARFSALDLDWDLVREPDLLEAGESVMIPDFAFDYAPAGRDPAGDDGSAFRVFFEVMGFWTPEYVETKLAKLDAVDDVELLVAVDESLGVGEAVEARDHRVVTYAGTVRVKDVVDALRRYEETLRAESAAALPEELRPDDDVVTLATLAERHGVSEAVVEAKAVPEHVLVGRTLVRPGVLDALAEEVAAGMDLAEVEDALAAHGIEDASAALAELGYRVEWDGLSGGTVRERE
jgi:predicted nuclease of restriction endonuclease-like RecB superfamily